MAGKNPYEEIGEAATATLLYAAEKWPELKDLQALLAPSVAKYQHRKEAGIAVSRDLTN